MDLKQVKLNKNEWESIEIPVSYNELQILDLIIKGYNNINILQNKNNSLFTYLKINYNKNIEEYLYYKYFHNIIIDIINKYDNIKFITFKDNKDKKELKNEENDNILNINLNTKIHIKSSDKIRINNMNINIKENENNIYELILINNIEYCLKFYNKNNNLWMKYYYTLQELIKNNIPHINRFIIIICNELLKYLNKYVNLLYIIVNSEEFIEKNTILYKYYDKKLYTHQKEIFSINFNNPKLVLYTAPTGTGKTITPIGLSEKNRIIFVCAARHIGLALARSAISIKKKIAFAFGCNCADDIRLHYYSAKEYTKNYKSGSIYKIDNSIGDKVEIIITDIHSYIYAMYYMLAFNSAENIITYWDEPTISMDYHYHELHDIIHRNWKENIIPNIILSSATLPKINEMRETILDFENKFTNADIIHINSFDCNKSIPLINNNGFIIMPHYITNNYENLINIANNCRENTTILRYLNLNETSKFINYIISYHKDDNKLIYPQAYFNRTFTSINNINITNIKLYYLKLLLNIIPEKWNNIYLYFNLNKVRKIYPNLKYIDKYNNNNNKYNNNNITKISSIGPGINTQEIYNNTYLKRTNSYLDNNILNSVDNNNNIGIYITTMDSYTLTDGPTIFIAENVDKIAQFCIQQANIPVSVMEDIITKINFNNNIKEYINKYETQLEFERNKILDKINGSDNTSKKTKKVNKNEDKNIIKIIEEIKVLRGMIKQVNLNEIFIPNKIPHLKKWLIDEDNNNNIINNPFTSNINEEIITSIMLINDIEDSWKILLLMGIGVFTEHNSTSYIEIMKKLADNQQLYLIIANSDYIYGTNYQFCHCYLSKDLNLTQEKIIQALGRVGRNFINQDYTIRFRNNEQIYTLFNKINSCEKLEVININKLFNNNL